MFTKKLGLIIINQTINQLCVWERGRERKRERERKKEREIEWSGILEIPRLKNDTKREREREREIMKKKT